MDLFSALPAELLIEIYKSIGYLDAIRLSQASRHFYLVVDPQIWPTAEKEAFVHDAERWKRHNLVYHDNRFNDLNQKAMVTASDGFACFSCYKVLDKSAFSRNQTERRGAKSSWRFQHIGHKRFCIDCGLRQAIYRAARTWMHSVTEHSLILSPPQILQRVTKKTLRVCVECRMACEYDIVSPPEVCRDCEDVQAEIFESQEGMTAMRKRRGWVIIQCHGCKGYTNYTTHRMLVKCESCDDNICRKCYGSTESCDCAKAQENFNGFAALPNPESLLETLDFDIFAGDKKELLGILDLYLDD